MIRPTGRGFGAALAVSCILTALWALPIVAHPNSRLLGGPSDATSGIRDYWYYAHTGKTPFSATHDSFVAAPEGIPLSPAVQAANAVQPLVIWALKGEIGLVAAWNVFVLGGIALTGACTWLLLRSLGFGRTGSAFGAYAFAASGSLIDKAFSGFGGLVQAWVFPLILLCLLARRTSPRPRLLSVLTGLLVALAFYLHSYWGAFSLFLVAAFYVYEWVTDRARRRDALQALATTGTALVAGLLPALVAMRVLASAPGSGEHSFGELQRFGARLPAYIAPAKWSPLGHLVPQTVQQRLDSSAEPSLFFGFSTLALAAYYLLRVRKTRPAAERFATGFALALVVAAFIMALPREFAVGPVHIPAPSWFISHVSTTIRVYGRFGILVGLGLVVLAAAAVHWIELRRGARWAAACVVVLALELTPTLPAQTWRADAVPAADRWLADHPGGITAIYPLAGDQPAAQKLGVAEYYLQRFHGHPLFSAFSPSMSPMVLALHYICQYFTPETAGILAAEHVRYVVVRDDVYRTVGEEPPTLPASEYRQVAQVTNARIFRVIAPAIDLPAYEKTHGAELAAATGQLPPTDEFRDGFYGPETFQQYGTPWRWLSNDGTIRIKPAAGVRELRFDTLAFSNGTSRVLRLYGPGHTLLGTATVPTSMVPVSFGPFPVEGGESSTYTLEATPGPTPLGGADTRTASVYVNEPVFKPILPAGG